MSTILPFPTKYSVIEKKIQKLYSIPISYETIINGKKVTIDKVQEHFVNYITTISFENNESIDEVLEKIDKGEYKPSVKVGEDKIPIYYQKNEDPQFVNQKGYNESGKKHRTYNPVFLDIKG